MNTAAIIAALTTERDRIDTAIKALSGIAAKSVATTKLAAAKKGEMSPEGRKRVAEAQKRRWAKVKKAAKKAA